MIGVMTPFSQTVSAKFSHRKVAFGAEAQQPQPAAVSAPAKAGEPTAQAGGRITTPVEAPKPVAPPAAAQPAQPSVKPTEPVQAKPTEKPAATPKTPKPKRVKKQALGKQIYKAFLKEVASNSLTWRVDGYNVHEGKRVPSAFVAQMTLDPDTIRYFDKLKMNRELFQKGSGTDRTLRPVEIRLWKSHQDDLIWEVAQVNIHNARRQNGALILWPVNTLLNAVTGRPLGHFLTPIPGVLNEYRSNHIFNVLTQQDARNALGRTPKAEAQVVDQQRDMARKALWATVLKAAQKAPKPVEITQDVQYSQARKLYHLAPVAVKAEEAQTLGFPGETSLKVTLVEAREWEFFLNGIRQFPQLLSPPSLIQQWLGLRQWSPHHREFHSLQKKVVAALAEKPKVPKATQKAAPKTTEALKTVAQTAPATETPKPAASPAMAKEAAHAAPVQPPPQKPDTAVAPK